MRLHGPLYLIVPIILLSSCNISRKAEKSVSLEKKTPQFLYQQLNDSAFRCNWFTGKLNATVDFQKKETSFTASIRLKKDSIIWVSISALGIEVVRAVITRDTLKMIDKLGARYMITNYDYLDGLLQLSTNFNLIQNLILGNYFNYVEIEKLNSSRIVKNNYVLESFSKKRQKKPPLEELVREELWLDPYTYKINKMMVDDSRSKRELSIAYNDYRRVEGQIFPFKTEFLRNTQDPVKVSLEYVKVSVNKPVTFPFSIPENYKPRE
jgi:hypothetical protein